MNKQLKFAPKEIFNQILDYAVIPTFDLVIDVPKKGVIIVRRKIAPYASQWALPGLRMMKPEGIEDVLERIAASEVGLSINVNNRAFLGQYVGRFKTEHSRQDISTGYAVEAISTDEVINKDHFVAVVTFIVRAIYQRIWEQCINFICVNILKDRFEFRDVDIIGGGEEVVADLVEEEF